jgi:hypothetical protein
MEDAEEDEYEEETNIVVLQHITQSTNKVMKTDEK